jgi:hypothetical protein
VGWGGGGPERALAPEAGLLVSDMPWGQIRSRIFGPDLSPTALPSAQPLDCSLHPDRCVLHLRQYILHPVYIPYIPGVLRVWGWDLRHSGGAPVRVVSAVSRPGGAREGARGSAKTPAYVYLVV